MKPINLKPWEVRAIQAGATLLVRPINRISGHGRVKQFQASTTPGYDWQFRCRRGLWQDYRNAELMPKLGFGGPGEILWGRETWAPYSADAVDEEGEVIYRASYDANRTGDATAQGATMRLKIPVSTCVEWSREIERYEVLGERWRPSTQMPLWASRFRLEVKSVRCLRVQELSEADAIKAGVASYQDPVSAVDEFEQQWSEDHGPDAWGRNDWVAVCEFEKQETA